MQGYLGIRQERNFQEGEKAFREIKIADGQADAPAAQVQQFHDLAFDPETKHTEAACLDERSAFIFSAIMGEVGGPGGFVCYACFCESKCFGKAMQVLHGSRIVKFNGKFFGWGYGGLWSGVRFWLPTVGDLLVLVKFLVRSVEQRCGFAAIFRKDGNPVINSHGGGRREGVRILLELPCYPVRQCVGAGSLRLRKKESELISANPAGNVRPADGFHAGAGDAAQDLVSGGMPVSVVGALEAAEIQ